MDTNEFLAFELLGVPAYLTNLSGGGMDEEYYFDDFSGYDFSDYSSFDLSGMDLSAYGFDLYDYYSDSYYASLFGADGTDSSYYDPAYDAYYDPMYQDLSGIVNDMPSAEVPSTSLPTSEELFALQGIDPNMYMDQMNTFFDSFIAHEGAPGGNLYSPPLTQTPEDLSSFFDSLFEGSMNVPVPDMGQNYSTPSGGSGGGTGFSLPSSGGSSSSTKQTPQTQQSQQTDISKILASILGQKTPVTAQSAAQAALPVVGSGANAVQSFLSSDVAGIPVPWIAGGIALFLLLRKK